MRIGFDVPMHSTKSLGGGRPREEAKPFKCTVAGCTSSFKKKSGLKSHAAHFHVQDHLKYFAKNYFWAAGERADAASLAKVFHSLFFFSSLELVAPLLLSSPRRPLFPASM